MLRSHRLLALVFLFSLVLPNPTGAEGGLKAKFKKTGGAAASDYPECHSELSAERTLQRNAEYQLTREDMHVVEPKEGRAKVGPLKLDFCDQLEPVDTAGCPPDERAIGSDLQSSMFNNYLDPPTIRKNLRLACTFPDDPGFQEAAGYVLQEWVNSYGQSREEALESLLLRANTDEWKKQREAGCIKMTISEEASPLERWTVLAERAAVGCGDGEKREMYWHVDQSDQPPSELSRLYYARTCLMPLGSLDTTKKSEWPLVGTCGHDVRALSREKIDKEVAQMPAPLQAVARERLAQVKALYADLERAVKPAVDSDPAYKRLLYDTPQAAWNAWMKDYQKHKKALDAAFKFENALFGPSTKAYEECWKWVEPGAMAFVKAGKFKSKERFLEVMTGPVGYTLLNALAGCYAATAPATVGELLLRITIPERVWRGPRAAVRYAMLDTLNEILADRPRFPVKFTWINIGLSNHIIEATRRTGERSRIPSVTGCYYEESEGVVKSVKKVKGDNQTLAVDFKTETWMEDTRECWNTNRIRKIDTHGDVLYHRQCKSTGKKKKSYTPPKMGFQNWATKGMKPNVFMRVAVKPVAGHAPRGYPIEIYTNKKQTKLVNLYGFEL